MHTQSVLKDGRPLDIRHAQPTDAAELVGYLNRSAEESDFLSFGGGDLGLSIEEEAQFIRDLDGGRCDFMLVGTRAERIISTCTIMRSKRARLMHIGELGVSVAKSHWGLGVGQAMCLAMLQTARQVGVTKVELKVREDNARAIRLYERVGFQREGLTARGLKVAGCYFNNVLMGLCLD